jgi:small subunit ribosomal protein S5
LHAKKNLIAVPLDHFMSFPRELVSKYNSVVIRVMPQTTFNSWGSPVLASMLLTTGITHCRFKLLYGTNNPYALVMAFFKLVTQNLTPRQLCERTGKKVYRENWGIPYPMDQSRTMLTF